MTQWLWEAALSLIEAKELSVTMLWELFMIQISLAYGNPQ